MSFLQIDYTGKGYFSGKAHSFKAVLTQNNGSKSLTFDGQWDTTSKSKSSSELKSLGVLDANGHFTDVTRPKEEVSVKPIEEQEKWESRRLWKVVSAGIRGGDFDTAAKDKSRIEVSLFGMMDCGYTDPGLIRMSRGSEGRTSKLLARNGI